MGKKGSSKKGPTATSGPRMSVTIREASTGKKHTNAKSSIKLQHIKNLAVWASRDANIPSLGAFFGHHLAASSEAFGSPVDPSLLTCQRCESILHPGYNCTIRIEKNKKNARRKGTKTTPHPQNNIVYTCHFCSHRNVKRGTPRNTSQPKIKSHLKSTNQKTGMPVSSSDMIKGSFVANTIAAPLGPTTDDPHKGETSIGEIKNGSDASGPATPLTRPTMTLLESKMKKRKRSGPKKKAVPESSPNVEKSSKRRRRKSWTSLREIA
ncbi:hypothetical protein SSX86_021913 [Deinandra increscens subsp. villosa]|uniref:Rpr2-domain-containing protein n=1 Tax=Deinandra increscens subsp. villosa TaxID=3103831 RepID=A0AAP0GT22_9ASTR